MRMVRSVVAVGCGLMLLATIGCGPGPKDMQIEALQARVNDLQAEKQGLMSDLARSLGERDEARGRALDLRQQLAELRARMGSGEARQEGRWTRGEGIAWTDIADNILFASGKANLKASGRAELQNVVAEVRDKFPGWQIWIIGHTDSDPIKHSKWKDNLELSVHRACAVHRELAKLGLNVDELVAAGQGEYNPKAPNDAKNKHFNRRVQIVAVQTPVTSGGIEETGEQG